MGKSLAWALLVLLTAAGGGVAAALYFAVAMGVFDAVFGTVPSPDGYMPGLGERSGIAGFSFGVPAGALFGGLLIDEGFRKDDSWALMIPSLIVIAALFVFCLYFYFSQETLGLITTYKVPGLFSVLGLFAFVGWFGKKVMGQK